MTWTEYLCTGYVGCRCFKCYDREVHSCMAGLKKKHPVIRPTMRLFRSVQIAVRVAYAHGADPSE